MRQAVGLQLAQGSGSQREDPLLCGARDPARYALLTHGKTLPNEERGSCSFSYKEHYRLLPA